MNRKGKDNPMFGKTPWSKGKEVPHNPEWERNRIKAIRESAKKRIYTKGWKHTESSKKKMSEKIKAFYKKHPEAKFNSIKNLPKDVKREKNGNWRGGTTYTTRNIRKSDEYKKWVEAVLLKNKSRCTWCESTKDLQAHHIYPVKEILRNDRLSWLFDVNNGITLCKDCHKKTQGYASSTYKFDRFIPDLRNIRFEVLDEMRYDTVGDYTNDGVIMVYGGMNKIERWAVAIHELVEFVLLSLQGIPAMQVDEWDTGDSGGSYDPSMYDKDERYRKAHDYATEVERKIIETAGIKWEYYDKTLDKLQVKWKKSLWTTDHRK